MPGKVLTVGQGHQKCRPHVTVCWSLLHVVSQFALMLCAQGVYVNYLAITLLLLSPVNYAVSQHVTLDTKLGKLSGITSFVSGIPVYKFLGIPYAKPPIGERRFSKPEVLGHFGYLEARSFGSICVQYDLGANKHIGEENCLFLNVFTPDITGSKSVMVWIHGGSFLSGSSSEYPADALAALNDVVVVTINYRLNIFGFLTTGDRVLPGNLGLWDQHLALKWVSDNIADYGGNSKSVTMFGESAGGRSAIFQMFSPHNDISLFQRVIAESGSALSFTFLSREPQEVIHYVSERTGCPVSNTFVQCMRSKPLAVIAQASRGMKRPFPFLPIVDNDFLPHDLGYLFSNFTTRDRDDGIKNLVANFHQYDLMAGWNDQEGLVYMRKLNTKSLEIDRVTLDEGISEEVLTASLKEYPFYKYGGNTHIQQLVVDVFKKFYHIDHLSNLKPSRPLREQRVIDYMNIAGDVVLKLPVVQTLQLHSALSNKSTYGYEFSHKRSWPGYWYDGPDWLRTGADHTDEIPYVFGFPFLKESVNTSNSENDAYIGNLLRQMAFTHQDGDLSRQIMSIWVNFAESGGPGYNFTEFSFSRNQSYIYINCSDMTILNYPLYEQQRLWSAIDSAIIKLATQEISLLDFKLPTHEYEEPLRFPFNHMYYWLAASISITIFISLLVSYIIFRAK